MRGRECSGREQQRVARQEWRHDESRLAEDDQKQKDVRPGADPVEHLSQMSVEVQKQVDHLLNPFHHGSQGHKACSVRCEW